MCWVWTAYFQNLLASYKLEDKQFKCQRTSFNAIYIGVANFFTSSTVEWCHQGFPRFQHMQDDQEAKASKQKKSVDLKKWVHRMGKVKRILPEG